MDNILTIDLEEWYHPEYVKNKAPTNKENRVTESLDKTLGFLNECDVRATFFVVGELAEKCPEILERIKGGEHEIAFHGHYHEPLWKLNPDALQSEIENFKALTKGECLGYRAPSFSLNNDTSWALDILEKASYKYDSSIFPTRTFLYGVWRAPTRPYKPSHRHVEEEDENAKLWEFPLLTYSISGLKIPVAGGFYLRLLPLNLIRKAITKANKHGIPAVIFVHSWELDSQIPKLKLDPYRSFVTYYNIAKTEAKLRSTLRNFKFTSFRNYVENVGLN